MKKMTVALMVVAVLAASACTHSGSDGATRVPNPPFIGDAPQEAYVYKREPGLYAGALVMAEPSALKTFNPIIATGASTTHVILVHVFRCLVDYRNGDDPPDYDVGLCTKWEASPDAKQWTFYLRRGVLWSDGQPFTADDVLFTYDVIRDPNVESPLRDAFKEGQDSNGKPVYPEIQKLDDHTVRFELHSSSSSFLDAIYNLWLIPRHKWGQAWREGKFNETMKASDDPNDIVSLGPFRVKEHVAGQRVELERNPYFWKVDTKGQRLPYLDRIVFVVVPNFNTILSKFQAGEIDAMWRVRADEYALVKRLQSPDIIVEDTGVSYDTSWIALNLNTGISPSTGKPYLEPWKQRLFRNQKFRQAVSYAIDRVGLANTVYAGRGEPIYSFITPGDKYWYTDSAVKYPYDPARARQLLAEMGLKDTNGDGVLEDQEGHSVEISILAFSGNDQRVNIGNFLVSGLKDVGIRAKLDLVPFSTLLDKTESTFDFDVAVGAWQSGTPSGPTNSKNILLSSGAQHVCFPKQTSPSTEWEAGIDQLLHQIEASLDPAERKRLFSEIDRIWSEQLPEINLMAERYAVAYKSKFANIRPSPLFAHLTWNCEEIYIKQ